MIEEIEKSPALCYIPCYDEGDKYALLHANDMFCVLWDILETELRNKLKYGHEFKTADEALEWCRSCIVESLEHYGVNLDKF